MEEREYNAADAQVLAMFRKPHGVGGELPAVTVTVLPAHRAERALAVDERIQQMQKAMPVICAGAASTLIICLASAGWMAPGLAAVGVVACMLQGLGRYRKGC